MSQPTESTGLLTPIERLCAGQDASGQPVTAAAARYVPGADWITQEMVQDTQQVWSPHYGHDLSDAQAVEILMNVRQLVQILWKGAQSS